MFVFVERQFSSTCYVTVNIFCRVCSLKHTTYNNWQRQMWTHVAFGRCCRIVSGEQLGEDAPLAAASLSESLADDTPVSSLSSQLPDAALSDVVTATHW